MAITTDAPAPAPAADRYKWVALSNTTLGVFNNRKSVVGFLVWEEIAGLLQYDMIPEALLTFFAQAVHAHSRGTWTAIECVDMDRARGAHSPYCLPAQMTVPIAAKWLLVYEDPVTDIVTLGWGLPRECLEDAVGQAQLLADFANWRFPYRCRGDAARRTARALSPAAAGAARSRLAVGPLRCRGSRDWK